VPPARREDLLIGLLVSVAGLYSSSSIAAAQQCSSSPVVPAYAHNDYNNAHPLQDALALGYQGVEADYVVVRGRLLVAHSRREADTRRTLEDLYLAPLRKRVELCGWVQVPGRPFLLNIEYKDRSASGIQALRRLLRKYSDLLGTAAKPGPVRVVLVGWHPPLRELRDGVGPTVTVQARLSRAGLERPEGDTALVGLISLDYGKVMRWKGRGLLSRQDRQVLTALAAARRVLPGKAVRAYNVPLDPAVYRLLLASGVHLIGTEKLRETAAILAH
jgi:hypothetical protein